MSCDLDHDYAVPKVNAKSLDDGTCELPLPKYRLITIQQRIEVIEKVEQGIPKAEVARAYGVSPTAVDRTWQNREKFKAQYKMMPPDAKRTYVSQKNRFNFI